MLSRWGRVQAKAAQACRQTTERKCECECMAILSVSMSQWLCMQTSMKDSENGTTCTWVRRVAESTNVRAKKFHACDNDEIAMKLEIVLGQASIHVNDRKRSKKSSKHYLHKRKHKKWHKCNTRHGKRAYPKIVELNVPTTPRCDVRCQSCKVDVRN